MKKLERITIVGGGTAGFVCALILKTRFPNTEISVVCSKKIGIIGYGNIGTQLSVVSEALGMDVYFYDIMDKMPLGNAISVLDWHPASSSRRQNSTSSRHPA